MCDKKIRLNTVFQNEYDAFLNVGQFSLFNVIILPKALFSLSYENGNFGSLKAK
jgi:hypothetical protein